MLVVDLLEIAALNVGPKIATFKELPWNNLYFPTLLHHSSDHFLVSILKLEYVGVLSLDEWLELLLVVKSSGVRDIYFTKLQMN